MPVSSDAHQLLQKATALLPASDEDLIYKGIAAGVSERIMALKKTRVRLQRTHGSREELERKVESEGVSPDDHTLYTDLLEWRAIDHELSELLHMLEAL
jgi:uroporphyrinogen-III synthase